MSLWAEHIGVIEEDFNYPESLECMRRVRRLGNITGSSSLPMT
jgi:phospholipase D1/2